MQPTAYKPQTNFLEYANQNASAQYPPAKFDAELSAIERTTREIRNSLTAIQRDDSKLKNASVHVDAFSSAALALMGSKNWTPKGIWLTGTSYSVGDLVEQTNITYCCVTAHVSGAFATDYAASKWIKFSINDAGSVVFSPYGNIAAATVQAALQELDDEKFALAGGTLTDGANIVLGTVTGTKIGTSVSQKLGFFNVAPVVQPSGAGQAAVSFGNVDGAISGLTISAAYSQAEVQALRNACEVLADDTRALKVLVDSLRAAGISLGVIKGSA